MGAPAAALARHTLLECADGPCRGRLLALHGGDVRAWVYEGGSGRCVVHAAGWANPRSSLRLCGWYERAAVGVLRWVPLAQAEVAA